MIRREGDAEGYQECEEKDESEEKDEEEEEEETDHFRITILFQE